MKLIVLSCAILFLSPLFAAADAQPERPVLIELFASQNCNACPRAHKTLQSVQAEHGEDVFVLTWSVDYWDYLGAPDPMAIPAATERQAAYTERLGLRAPYTPQSVYDGAKQCPATHRATVEANIETRAATAMPGDVRIAAAGPGSFSLDGYTTEPVEVRLVEFLDGPANPTAMVHPVTRTQMLGQWTGGRVSFSFECEASCAAIVQAPKHGEVYAAQRLN